MKTSEIYGDRIARVLASGGRGLVLAVEARRDGSGFRTNLYREYHTEEGEARHGFMVALTAPAVERLIAGLQKALGAMRPCASPERFDAKETGE